LKKTVLLYILLLVDICVFAETDHLKINVFADDSLSAAPTFSLKGGFYKGTQALTLSSKTGSTIYYTLDGHTPTMSATLYSVPIQIGSTTSVRVIVIEPNKYASEILTQTYFIDEPINLPIISLSTDPEYFFSDTSGIYVTGTNGIKGSCDPVIRNLNQDWERPVNIEFYEKDGKQGLNQIAGIKIFGGCSRTRFPQKSFSLFARKVYGKGSFKYQLFPDKDIKKFESFLLRSSADDQVRTMFKDAFAAYSIKDNMEIDYMAYRPVAVFINAQYWGIHNMREKVNEHYIDDNFEVDNETINVLESNATASQGKNEGYNAMIKFIAENNLSNLNNYNAIKKLIDINQFTDYFIANIHLAEVDWPGNNIKFWNSDDSKYDKWRWIVFDRDQTYLPNRIETNALQLATATNGPSWPNPPWSTFLLRNLLDNPDFKNRFIQTYAFHLTSTFNAERVSSILDQFKEGIAAEIPRHIKRWGGQLDLDKSETWPIPTFNSVTKWESNIEEVRQFLPAREPFALSHIKILWGTNERVDVTMEATNIEHGNVYFYDKVLKKPTIVKLFKTIPFQLKAIPKNGYMFSHWEIDGVTKTEKALELKTSNSMNIKAFFKPVSAAEIPLVINEINYNSPDIGNTGDWVEIYNPNDFDIDLEGWRVQDGNIENEYRFEPQTIIEAKNFMVLCESVTLFDSVFNLVGNRVGGMGFKFSNSDEVIKLLSSDNVLVDSVHYMDKAPWPEEADGEGSTLELIDPHLDNKLAESWRASKTKGSPGYFNYEELLAIQEDLERPFQLFQNYPNPVLNGQTKIAFKLKEPGNVELRIFDAYGREIEKLLNEYLDTGKYEKQYTTTSHPSGMYYIILKYQEQYIDMKKMLVE
jgi:hypothetical protein